jgi:hypothetical protein
VGAKDEDHNLETGEQIVRLCILHKCIPIKEDRRSPDSLKEGSQKEIHQSEGLPTAWCRRPWLHVEAGHIASAKGPKFAFFCLLPSLRTT